MSHSYSGNPAASDLDWIRFTIQDTGPAYSGEPWYIHDSEISGILAGATNATQAAGLVLLAWARRIAHSPNFRIGRFSEDWNAAAATMQEKAEKILASAAAAGIGAFVGGISVSDKATRSLDTDRTKSSFRRGQFDNPDAGW
ncbi:MAG TPA: hypothetical protein VNA25_30510 [Phycisphaerae bacterium]|nr:hypothetical protein [Phycisphaerae bacterium]